MGRPYIREDWYAPTADELGKIIQLQDGNRALVAKPPFAEQPGYLNAVVIQFVDDKQRPRINIVAHERTSEYDTPFSALERVTDDIYRVDPLMALAGGTMITPHGHVTSILLTTAEADSGNLFNFYMAQLRDAGIIN